MNMSRETTSQIPLKSEADSSISNAQSQLASETAYVTNGNQDPIEAMAELLPNVTAVGHNIAASGSYTNGVNFPIKSEHGSPKSIPQNAIDSQHNTSQSYLQYSDDSKLVLSHPIPYNDGQYNSPYSIPPQNPVGSNPLVPGPIASTGPASSNNFATYDGPMEDFLIVGELTNDLLSQFIVDLRAKSLSNIRFIQTNELSFHDIGESLQIHLCLSFNSGSTEEFENLIKALRSNETLNRCKSISYHIAFCLSQNWADTPKDLKSVYCRFLDTLKEVGGDKVDQCSILRKYDSSTVYITEIDALVSLGKEISEDISRWENLRILDYSHNCLRLLPGVTLPNSLQVLNVGGGESLETLAGFKIPQNLRVLDVSNGQLKSADFVFPPGLRRLNLLKNSIYSLDYVKLPQQLSALDLSENRIDTIKYINFPRELTYLSIAYNPIECMKGARFPENVEYLDVSCIPNESMAGIKFPDSILFLNLQLSMTNTRGLKLPLYVRELNMACDGVNSINPLKLPNSIEKLFLSNNNIKTLSKVTLPSALKELYLGNNLITTLKNVLFPPTLEVLDMEMNPDLEDNEKDISSLKDVIFPANLRILRLGYHLIKAIESMEFPYYLEELSLQYNDLRMFRNVKFGSKLRLLDLSGNQELMSMDNVLFPESLVDMRIPSTLLSNLPADIVKRANKKELILTKSLPYTI